ncbi:phytanoyl-CoA dioxygenase-like protein [Glonium stellatum]|uniref:Phytanoyl-CoA dioxygenase-like protein n=1 Tax=Glonium stellatum TaxID=574774 RepID=A0A8E2FB90_9PEZI|nr:phytanoyl-CoA dioxygenase-like protein [Glonium stellatum]
MNPNHVSGAAAIPSRCYSLEQSPSLETFTKLCSQKASSEDYPLSSSIQSNIPIYNLADFSHPNPSTIFSLQDEWHHIILSGPGVFVVKGLFRDQELIEKVNSVYRSIITSEKSSAKGDHFAGSGKNDRIWNSFSKHGMLDPSSFLQYYSNPWIARICDAWLGPAYRVTAQVNAVKPGGAAQVSHRDYHLGFQTADATARFPKAMQVASQLLTLQGAVAHTDMPLDSGPTRFLPFSQLFAEGFMAYRLPQFNEYFLYHYVSLPLEKGDGVFFNPALFHAAGENRTETFERSANLLQISSAFGKPMETVDSLPLVKKCWMGLVQMYKEQGMSAEVEAFIAAVAEGYPFPTNLDRRPPAPGGMAPESEQDVLRRALIDGLGEDEVLKELTEISDGSKP